MNIMKKTYFVLWCAK